MLAYIPSVVSERISGLGDHNLRCSHQLLDMGSQIRPAAVWVRGQRAIQALEAWFYFVLNCDSADHMGRLGMRALQHSIGAMNMHDASCETPAL